MRALVLLASVALVLTTAAQATVRRGALAGVVMRGPIVPVCAVEQPCDEPARGVTLLFSRGDRVVGRVVTDDEGRYRLRCVMGERIRVVEWQPDDPYPRAAVEPWPDEPGDAVDVDAIRDIEDRIVALFERIATARGAQVVARDIVAGADESGDPSMWLYTLASRLPMGQADRYAVLSAPSVSARTVALRDAVETVTAMVEFQLSE